MQDNKFLHVGRNEYHEKNFRPLVIMSRMSRMFMIYVYIHICIYTYMYIYIYMRLGIKMKRIRAGVTKRFRMMDRIFRGIEEIVSGP